MNWTSKILLTLHALKTKLFVLEHKNPRSSYQNRYKFTSTPRGGRYSLTHCNRQIKTRGSVEMMQEDSQINSEQLSIDESPHPEDDEDGYLLYIEDRGKSCRLPLKVRLGNGQTTRVGWVDPHAWQIIFHSCLKVGHIAPQCNLKLYKFDKVVRNYESILYPQKTEIESHVPRIMIRRTF